MTDQEFATYLSAWEVARNARDQDPTSASIARANSAREAYLTALDIQRGDARELTVEGPVTIVPGDGPSVHVTFTEESNAYRVTIPGVPQEARAHYGKLPDFASFYRLSAPAPEPRVRVQIVKRGPGPGPTVDQVDDEAQGEA